MWNYGHQQQRAVPAFPNPQGGNSGYSPSYSSPPPPGPLPRGFPDSGAPHIYAPPPGPPPGPYDYGYPPPGAPPSRYPGQEHHYDGYPGQGYHHNQYQSDYASQGGPPPQSYAPPSGPPPRPPAEDQAYGPSTEGGDRLFFRYSQCSGRKKALCIGINYINQNGELGGCINDAINMRNFLCRRFGYKAEDIVMLRDDSKNPMEIPTKANMLRAMQWLVKDARPNDSLFFHYSGHGGQTKDLDGDEEDGYDEVIYPVDFDTNGHIVDDLLHEIMVKPLPPGCRLTSIFDSCHSGTAIDLPYVYSTEGKVKEPNLMAAAGQDLLSTVTSYARGDMSGVFRGAVNLVKVVAGNGQKAQKVARATKTSPADAISWSGCKDSQTSADTQEAGQATGAMSYAFISAIERNPQQSYQQLLSSIRDILRAKYSQKPQLSCSHPMASARTPYPRKILTVCKGHEHHVYLLIFAEILYIVLLYIL
ncbi:hypothetical protein AX15_000503 [Amanita polypyramis BW_CC]|nr:hypothetical protein AX15_000503 [Amanita polypyramis BW_CC]